MPRGDVSSHEDVEEENRMSFPLFPDQLDLFRRLSHASKDMLRHVTHFAVKIYDYDEHLVYERVCLVNTHSDRKLRGRWLLYETVCL